MPTLEQLVEKLTHFQTWRLFKRIESHTMVGHERLYVLYDLAERIERQKVEGDIVECGVWKGGAAGVLAHVIKHFGYRRSLWLFDSFAGMPEPSSKDGQKAIDQYERDKGLSSVTDVEEVLFNRLDIRRDAVTITPGWFENTLPIAKEKIKAISLLRLDCDWYEATKVCLETLYDAVVPGGYVLFDDYGSWTGCRIAVDEFLKNRGLTVDLKPAGSGAVYFQKPLSDLASGYWSEETTKYKQPHLRLKRIAREIIERTPVNGEVLDIGCSYGTLGTLLTTNELHYSGIDVFDQTLPVGDYGRFDLNRSPFVEFPFQKTFDTVVISGVLEYLPEERIHHLLNHIAQHLTRPSSTVIISYTNFEHYQQTRGAYHPQWITTISSNEMRNWFKQAGLEIRASFPSYYFLFGRRLPFTIRHWIPFFSRFFGRQFIFILSYAGSTASKN